MSPIQQMLLGVGAVATKTYVDDVFAINTWVGNSTARNITNDIDLSTEGGMCWLKARHVDNTGTYWSLWDTERGIKDYLQSSNEDEEKFDSQGVIAFNTDGFRLGAGGSGNFVSGGTGRDYVGYTFRKSPGFFDCIKYTGGGEQASSPKTITHSLGCVPALIICKQRTDAWSNWFVYHHSLGEDKFLNLSKDGIGASYNGGFKNITSSSFGVFDSNATNSKDFIAYVFAGSKSEATGARSIPFASAGRYLSVGSSSDFTLGTNDFTLETWIYPESCTQDIGIPDPRAASTNAVQCMFGFNNSLQLFVYVNGSHLISPSSSTAMTAERWQHVAYCRNGSTGKIFLNGKEVASVTDNNNYVQASAAYGWHAYQGATFVGKLSNARIVNGTAVYTSEFTPPIEPLGNITNTKLLFCNTSTITGSTVTPGTVTGTGFTGAVTSQTSYFASGNSINGPNGNGEYRIWYNSGLGQYYYSFGSIGNTGLGSQSSYYAAAEQMTINLRNAGIITASQDIYPGGTSGFVATILRNFADLTDSETNNPFDDRDAFVFGENADQNIIKCGSYIGQGNSSGQVEIDVDWQPQYVLVKNASTAGTDWMIVDTKRGFGPHDINEKQLYINKTAVEDSGDPYNIKSTGWSLFDSNDKVNKDGDTYIYIAIRSSDGYVSKPVELATDVFTTVVGTSSNDEPGFTSGFDVDFALMRQPASSSSWWVGARLTQGKYLTTDTTSSESGDGGQMYDYDNGFYASGGVSDYNAWLWKRHSGFDVLSYIGDGSGGGRQIRHSLNKIPEMMWLIKTGGSDREVYHKGLGGGSSPETKSIKLNESDAESITRWQNTAPTNTVFSISSSLNTNNDKWRAFLFASVDGISKVGYYSGTSNQERGVDCGFVPRFIIIKQSNSSSDWFVFDTLRGINSTWQQGDHKLALNSSAAQDSSTDYLILTSSGFRLQGGNLSGTGNNYLFYAHA